MPEGDGLDDVRARLQRALAALEHGGSNRPPGVPGAGEPVFVYPDPVTMTLTINAALTTVESSIELLWNIEAPALTSDPWWTLERQEALAFLLFLALLGVLCGAVATGEANDKGWVGLLATALSELNRIKRRLQDQIDGEDH